MNSNLLTPPIPHWAIGTTTDYLAIGAQLCTRDGRRCGNAVTTAVVTRHGCNVAVVVTDMGTKMHLTESELQELFYPPEWLMDVNPIGKLGASIEQALNEAPVSDVLSILTGAFVGLTVELVRRKGHDLNLPIKVDGGPNRDITLHAPKGPAEFNTEQVGAA